MFSTWGKVQEYRYKRPFPDFSKSVEEILRLDKEIRAGGSRLAVIIFRTDGDYGGSELMGKIWNHLTNTVTQGLQNTGIPILDLGKSLCRERAGCTEYFSVYPMIDAHPNEVAHRIAAQQILGLLQSEHLLDR
jgi:hypothetical protein